MSDLRDLLTEARADVAYLAEMATREDRIYAANTYTDRLARIDAALADADETCAGAEGAGCSRAAVHLDVCESGCEWSCCGDPECCNAAIGWPTKPLAAERAAGVK